jgi:hypothetical protein
MGDHKESVTGFLLRYSTAKKRESEVEAISIKVNLQAENRSNTTMIPRDISNIPR